MKYLGLMLVLIMILSCKIDIPVANLQFQKIEKDSTSNGYFNIYFSSDVDLINSVNDRNLIDHFDCFFNTDEITQEILEDYKTFSLTSVNDLILVSKEENYNYVINTFFSSGNDSFSKNYMKAKRLLRSKDGDDCLKCVYNAVEYLSYKDRYVTNEMCLPKEALKKVMKKEKK